MSTLVFLGQNVHKVFGTHAIAALVHFTFAVGKVGCNLVIIKQCLDLRVLKGANGLAHTAGFFHHQWRTQQDLKARLSEVQTFLNGGVGCHAKGLLVVPDDGTFGKVRLLCSPAAGIQIGLTHKPTTNF